MTTGSSELLRAVRALDEGFVRAANAGDAASLVSGFYAEDAVLLPPNAPQVSGAAAIRGFWQGFLDAGAFDVTIETSTVDASGDLAYGLGTYGVTMPTPDGGRARDRGKFVVVYRRQADGGWKVIADAFSSDLPAS